MVTEVNTQDGRVYVCEICGYGYRDISVAESCEQHCDTQKRPSQRIRQKAVYHPNVEILAPVARINPHAVLKPLD